MPAFHLRIEAQGPTWRVLAGSAHGRRAAGSIDGSAVLVGGRLELPVLLLPGDDTEVAAAEQAAGRALGEVLRCSPEVAAALAAALATAGGPLLIVVETPDAGVAALPWELLADADGPLEGTGRAVIARRGAGSWREPEGSPAAWTWSPDPDDPVAAALIDRIGARRTPPPGSLLTWVVAHGQVAGVLALARGEGRQGAAGAVHLLAPALARSALVVLAVCAAGDVREVVDAVQAAGALACVAPRGSLGADAAGRFAQGLQGALADGLPLALAVAAGRRAVAAAGRPYPEDRAGRIALYLADDRAGDVVLASWRARAAALARRLGSGFVGVEHLALVLLEGPPEPALAEVRLALKPRADEIRDRLGRYLGGSGSAPPAPPPLTPRLAALPPDPWPTLLGSPALLELGGAPSATAAGDGTLPAWTADPTPAGPARSLEVVLGPEDGRVLTLTPGQTLGRAARDGAADHALYADRASDPRLSRVHLRWLGDGEIELVAPARLGERRVEGRIQLRDGDRLALTPGTLVRGRG